MTIDSLGKRYSMLPSEVLNKSNTFDLYIMDMAMTYENYVNQKAMNKGMEPVDAYDPDDLQELLNNVRNQ